MLHHTALHCRKIFFCEIRNARNISFIFKRLTNYTHLKSLLVKLFLMFFSLDRSVTKNQMLNTNFSRGQNFLLSFQFEKREEAYGCPLLFSFWIETKKNLGSHLVFSIWFLVPSRSNEKNIRTMINTSTKNKCASKDQSTKKCFYNL